MVLESIFFCSCFGIKNGMYNLFCNSNLDQVDLEALVMAGKLSMIVIGQDVLEINGEVCVYCRWLILSLRFGRDFWEIR